MPHRPQTVFDAHLRRKRARWILSHCWRHQKLQQATVLLLGQEGLVLATKPPYLLIWPERLQL